MHNDQETNSGEISQEDSTPFLNKQYVGPSITGNHCTEMPQHVDKTCHLCDCTCTSGSLDELSTLDAPDDHLLELDSTSLVF